MTASLLILSYLVVGFAGFFTAIYILGVGTWDGRGGGLSRMASPRSGGPARRDQVPYVEVHMMWRWRDAWWTSKDADYEKITRAIEYLQKAWNPADPFWEEMKGWKEGSTKVLPGIIKAIKEGGALWELRAYEDKDFKDREYRAIELSARVEVPCNFFPPEKEKSEMNEQEKERHEKRIQKRIPYWSPTVLQDILRDPEKNKETIDFYQPELGTLYPGNPMLKPWLDHPRP